MRQPGTGESSDSAALRQPLPIAYLVQPNHPAAPITARHLRPAWTGLAPALGLLCVLGAVSSVAALVIGFIPPSQFGRSNPVTYALLILAGVLAIGIVPPLLMDRLRRPGWKAT